MAKNIDLETVESFGDEWSRFDQSLLSNDEGLKIFNDYFSIFPWEILPEGAVGFDMGCGTGRWASFVAPRVGHLNCIDPSKALDIARVNLAKFQNISYYSGSSDERLLIENSQDFGYSLGVLHHIPDTLAALKDCVSLLKQGAPFLLYLYYAFDNRSTAFKVIWKLSNLMRLFISRLPPNLKRLSTDVIAIFVYYPIARLCRFMEHSGLNVSFVPLFYYRNLSFYTMRTDARDRFGTPLEQRFSKLQIVRMMEAAGLERIGFSDNAPFWCAIGFRK